MEQIKSIGELHVSATENALVLPEYEKEVRGLIEDVNIAKAVAKIIRNHKTKNGIHDYLEKKYGIKGQEYFRIIKPLIKDKK